MDLIGVHASYLTGDGHAVVSREVRGGTTSIGIELPTRWIYGSVAAVSAGGSLAFPCGCAIILRKWQNFEHIQIQNFTRYYSRM